MEILILLIIYVIGSYITARIGKKFGIGTTAQYFIPVYNQILLCRCARISAWWVLGLFLPYINLVATVYVFGSLGRQLGKSFWISGLGSFLLGITIFIMAFDNSEPVTALLPVPESETEVQMVLILKMERWCRK